MRQPGQLHFTTGFNFNFFGISLSSLNSCDIHCLPAGHWPSIKTVDEVASVLDYSIFTAKARNDNINFVKSLHVHADSCGGQENKYMLWYFLWRVTIGLECDIIQFFSYSWSYKKKCEGAFGKVKRELQTKNPIAPDDMFEVFRQSFSSNRATVSADVRWSNWKTFFEPFYSVPSVPSSFRITRYRVFSFES